MAKSKSSIKDKQSVKELINNKTLTETKIKEFLPIVEKLSYEESLEELNLILNNLQNESFLVEELQDNYLKARLYIQHCENLLQKIEQEVIELSTDELSSLMNK